MLTDMTCSHSAHRLPLISPLIGFYLRRPVRCVLVVCWWGVCSFGKKLDKAFVAALEAEVAAPVRPSPIPTPAATSL